MERLIKSKRPNQIYQLSTLAGALLCSASGLFLAHAGEPVRVDESNASESSVTSTTQPAVANAHEVVPASDVEPQLTQPDRQAAVLKGLIGSKHDFTRGGEGTRDLCGTCHRPHPPDSPVTQPASDAGKPPVPYVGIDVSLDRWSLMCLGCHDGKTAPGVYTASHATRAANQLAISRLSTARTSGHPVGVAYPTHDEHMNPEAAVEGAGLKLRNRHLQCSTCHDPHNRSGHRGMLRISNERSRLCLTCHRM